MLTRQEQLKYCKICKNQKFDPKQGIICALTNKPADFEDTCHFYIEDSKLKLKLDLKSLENEIKQKTANKGIRLGNYILDSICITILFLFFVFILSFLAAVILSPTEYYMYDNNNLIRYALSFFVYISYYTILESATGQTLGKMITNTKVINYYGQKPDFKTILIRNLCRFIPFEPLSFLFSAESGWHDTISKTKVITK